MITEGQSRKDPAVDDQAWTEAFDWMAELDRAPHDPAIKAGFNAWLARRESHAEIYAQLREVWETPPQMHPVLSDQRLQRPNAQATALPQRRRVLSRRQWFTGAAAAGVAAAFVVGSLTDLRADHATGTGERKAIDLADGSQMQLDTNSAICVAFSPKQREIVLLRGRAFFAVVKDAQRPFMVTAGRAQAVALGTKFDVRRDDDHIAVAVEEGQVAVTLDGRDLLARTLQRGDALTLDLATGIAQEAHLAPEAMGAWREDRLLVDDWTVAAVLDELGRYYSGMIVLRDTALGARRVSGIYDLRRPVDAMRAVAETQGGRVTEISPWLSIVSAG